MSWKKAKNGKLSYRSTHGHREEHCLVANEKKASVSRHRLTRQWLSLVPASLKNTMTTVKILALEFSVADLDATIGVLSCFPCIEKLYVNFIKWLDIPVNKHVHPTDPDPKINLKELVLNNYKGSEQDVRFAKFFVSNSQVLKKIRLGVIEKIKLETVSKEWMDHQYRLLEVGTSVQVEFVASDVGANLMKLDVFDLSTADPFASSYSQME